MAKIYYFMGASGSGKDSLIHAVRKQFEGELLVAPRYITRASDAGSENHIELSVSEFQLRLRLGLFAMHWQANGLYYGIGCEIDQWQSVPVLVNGSRAYYEQAKQDYGSRLQGVWVDVATDVLAQRLHQRGRESTSEIQARLERHAQFTLPHNDVIRINNNGSITESLDQFIQQSDIWQGATSL
ncbi:ribose 1,5-bisphosphokinase [Salinibius halmophilus]|uniref:ribose 1,5-bisphosphokinase n=1 Tax=Salinibius halmophilus TaxID=1853216 RepID=UPI000E66F66F|nr:ribose 1,5-bisphosphokinase [Salinibius halmophilus]